MHGTGNRIAVWCALLQKRKRQTHLIETRTDGRMEQETSRWSMEILLREINAQALNIKVVIAHQKSFRSQCTFRKDDLKFITVTSFATILSQRLGGVLQLLGWRIKNTRLFFAYCDGVKHDLSHAVAIAVFNQSRIQLARIVARIRIEGHL